MTQALNARSLYRNTLSANFGTTTTFLTRFFVSVTWRECDNALILIKSMSHSHVHTKCPFTLYCRLNKIGTSPFYAIHALATQVTWNIPRDQKIKGKLLRNLQNEHCVKVSPLQCNAVSREFSLSLNLEGLDRDPLSRVILKGHYREASLRAITKGDFWGLSRSRATINGRYQKPLLELSGRGARNVVLACPLPESVVWHYSSRLLFWIQSLNLKLPHQYFKLLFFARVDLKLKVYLLVSVIETIATKAKGLETSVVPLNNSGHDRDMGRFRVTLRLCLKKESLLKTFHAKISLI